ncbi:MAG: TolB family protein, partial [Vicinamibacterales bacterium]
MTDRHEIDRELDELGEAVRRAFAGESLGPEQQGRHLGRLRGRLGGRARSAIWGGTVEPEEPGGVFGRLTRIPRDDAGIPIRRPVLELAAGVVAVILVAAVLISVFEGAVRRNAEEDPAVGASLLPRARGWVYPGARLLGGGQLAFVSSVAGVPQIAVVNADGSGLDMLTNDAATHWGPDWSPDGRQLLWSS